MTHLLNSATFVGSIDNALKSSAAGAPVSARCKRGSVFDRETLRLLFGEPLLPPTRFGFEGDLMGVFSSPWKIDTTEVLRCGLRGVLGVDSDALERLYMPMSPSSDIATYCSSAK